MIWVRQGLKARVQYEQKCHTLPIFIVAAIVSTADVAALSRL